MSSGEIGFLHALSMAEETRDLTPAVAREVEQVVFAEGSAASLAVFRRRLRRAVLAADPVGADLAHQQAVAQREVRVQPEPAGMARLVALLTADEAGSVFEALTAAAEAPDSIHADALLTGIDMRRADALVGLVTGATWGEPRCASVGTAPDGATPRRRRRRRGRRKAQVTVDLPTLLGLRDEPGELAGYGPIPAGLARQLAADADWRLLITDPHSRAVIDRGRRCYRPPASLAAFVVARDGTCRFPGCPRAADQCDLDHREAWDDGGRTDADNLTALCRRHHRLKTHAGWQVVRLSEGSDQWTSPTGHRYRVPPYRAG